MRTSVAIHPELKELSLKCLEMCYGGPDGMYKYIYPDKSYSYPCEYGPQEPADGPQDVN